MKIGTLIDALKEFDPNLEVVLSSDGEGNSYSPAAEVTPELYIADSTWSGELVSDDPDDYDDDEDFEDQRECAEPVVVIWPTN